MACFLSKGDAGNLPLSASIVWSYFSLKSKTSEITNPCTKLHEGYNLDQVYQNNAKRGTTEEMISPLDHCTANVHHFLLSGWTGQWRAPLSLPVNTMSHVRREEDSPPGWDICGLEKRRMTSWARIPSNFISVQIRRKDPFASMATRTHRNKVRTIFPLVCGSHLSDKRESYA